MPVAIAPSRRTGRMAQHPVSSTRPASPPAVALMPQFDASNLDASFVQCAICDKMITGGQWFARMKHGNRMVALCCPLCTEVFTGNPQRYARRIEMLERGSDPGKG